MPAHAHRLLAAVALALTCPLAAAADDATSLRLDPALAQPSTPEPAAEPVISKAVRQWIVQVEPAVWFVAPSGELKLPVIGGGAVGDDVKIEDLNLDSTRLRPAGELHINADDWRFTFSGSGTSIDHDRTTSDSDFRLGGVDVAPGDAFSINLDFTSVELTVGYLVYSRAFGCPDLTTIPANACQSDLFIYVIGGARYYDVSFDFERFGGSGQRTAGVDETFGEPLIGARIEWEFAEDFFIDAQVTGGGLPLGDHSVYSLDVIAGFQWRPTTNLGVQIGYRQLAYWLSDGEDEDEFSWTGRLAGLYAGIILRF